jgi:voltage-gated potassium channel
MQEPVSVRSAAGVIVVSTTVVTILGALLMRLVAGGEFKSFGIALWWSLQTVTTIGYGDVTPTHTWGRVVAAVVMLYGVAFLSVLIAAITSSFVTRARVELVKAETPERKALEEIKQQLDRIEQQLAKSAD